MEKKVFLMFGQQCKCVKFPPNTEKIEPNIIRGKVEEICGRDKILMGLRHNKTIVLQVKDKDVDIWCDVEDEDVVANQAIIKVVFISLSDSNSPASSADPKNAFTITPTVVQAHEMHEELKIMYSEPADTQYEFHDEVNQQVPEDTKNIMIQKDSEKIFSMDKEPQPSCSGMSSRFSINLNVTKNYFQTLPPLPYDLEDRIKTRGILGSQKDLIYHWGSYLWEATRGSPTREDYQRLSSTIVRAYPDLGSSGGDSIIIRKSLSTWIRNHRATLKRQATKRDYSGRYVHTPSSAVMVKQEDDHNEVEQALKELDKKRKEGNTPHIRRNLKVTLPMRRTWIVEDAHSIIEIIRKYPQLANSELVVFEFCTLKNVTEDFLNKNIDQMFEKLTTFFNMEKRDDKAKAFCLELLYKRVTRLRTNMKPLITVEEVGSSEESLTTVEGESPRVVIYTTEENVATAYIVADSAVTMKIEKPTVNKIIISLLAAYYVWDVEYPKPYLNILEYFDHDVMGTPISKKNVVLLKFIQQRDYETKKLSSME